MANWAAELFGEELLTKTGTQATTDVLGGKRAVLVYFSAHWCPPCRGFTPMLADAYKTYNGGDVEVVFVSSDQDQGSFDGYFAEMPWIALPFSDRARKDKISQKFGVRGIPMLVVLNGEDGKVLKENGRSEVQSTKDLGKSMAVWTGEGNSQPPVASPQAASHWSSELFGDFIVTKGGKKATSDVITGKKAVLVYMSAHWCPPCRGFTPVLAETYRKYGGGDVEVVFVSSDQDQASFDGYFAEMPWTAVPFVDRERKAKISSKFGVQGIPMLIVLSEDGKVLAHNGRAEVQSTQDLGKCLALWGVEGVASKKKSCCCVIS